MLQYMPLTTEMLVSHCHLVNICQTECRLKKEDKNVIPLPHTHAVDGIPRKNCAITCLGGRGQDCF